MRGLILKDLLCLRKGLISILVVLGIYIALAFAGAWDISFMAGFLSVVITLLPTNCFFYDAAAKWDVYARTLPVRRGAVVAARYCTALLLWAAGLAALLVAGLLAGELERMGDWETYARTAAVCLALPLLMNAVMLPLIYRFGAERARIVFYGVLGALVLLAWVLFTILGGEEFLERLDRSAPSPALTALVLLAAALVLLALSFLLSVRFYQKKEL